MEEAGLVPMRGIMLMLVLHQTAERGKYEVLILGKHHRSFRSVGCLAVREDPSLGE
jgi:hypothetical protein